MSRPDRAYSAQVVRHWPDLSTVDADMHYRLLKAEAAVSTNLDLLTGELLTHRQREVKPRLRVTCIPGRHRSASADVPRLAEVWDTHWGVLFVAALAGAAGDPPDTQEDPFAPPLVLLPRHQRVSRRQPPAATDVDGWSPIPITVVRVFLPPPEGCRLWVKCPDCGPGEADWRRLNEAYRADGDRRLGHDSPSPSVLNLNGVGALYSRK